MRSFSYYYQSRVNKSFFEVQIADGNACYRVHLDSDCCIISPASIQSIYAKINWIEENKTGDHLHPHEFIQALGKGIEEAGLISTVSKY
jgi:hypothetical protein